jgi:hypothetical protein
VSLARLQHEMKAMPMRTVEVRTRNQGKVEYPKSQAFWAVRKRIRCTKIEGNAEAGQKQARSSINDTDACRAGDDRARESGHPRFHRRRPCLSTGLSRRLAPSTCLAPSTFCGGMEAWLTWSMACRTHGQDHGRPQMPPLPCWQPAVTSGRPAREYSIRGCDCTYWRFSRRW